MRSRLCLSVVLLSAGCFNPEPPTGEGLDTDSGGDESSSGGTSDPTGPGTDSTDPTVAETDTAQDTDDSTETGAADPVCGDGMVEGDEVCDDGVNDGAYGGCSDDCSALAAHCGDGEVSDDEACDDGVNDGSYGGCNDDCSLAAYCGDGSMDAGDELCDEGEANENGSGCNLDCTTSGTVLFESMQTGLSFCDGAFSTPARFDAEGNGLVAATGYCGDDSQLLQAFSPSLDVVETFDLLLPDTPTRQAAMMGDKWVLGAGNCNYGVVDGMLTEACGTERITGQSALGRVGMLGYFALDYGGPLALFPPESPSMGDAPLWEAMPPTPGFYEYTWNSAAAGPNDSILVIGQRYQPGNGDRVALLAQFTGAGNLVDTNTYAAVEDFTSIATGPDGTPLLYSRIPYGEPGYPGGFLTQLNAAFGVVWTIQLPNPGDVQIAVDSSGAPLILLEDGNGNGAYELRKLDRDNGDALWSVGLPQAGNDTRISVGPDDYTWVTAGGYGPMGAQLWVGRVTP